MIVRLHRPRVGGTMTGQLTRLLRHANGLSTDPVSVEAATAWLLAYSRPVVASTDAGSVESGVRDITFTRRVLETMEIGRLGWRTCRIRRRCRRRN